MAGGSNSAVTSTPRNGNSAPSSATGNKARQNGSSNGSSKTGVKPEETASQSQHGSELDNIWQSTIRKICAGCRICWTSSNGLVRLSLRSTIRDDSAGRVEARPLCQKPPSFWRLQGRPVWVPSPESFGDGAAKRSRDPRSGLTSLPSAALCGMTSDL